MTDRASTTSATAVTAELTYKRPNRDAVDTRTNYLTQSGLWPGPPEFNVPGWLGNFDEADLDFAYALLNAFLFIPSRWTTEMFHTGIRDLSRSVCDPKAPFVTQQRLWRSFLDAAIVTYITGEDPNPTDSGYAFARMARQVAGIEEVRIMHPEQAFAQARDTAAPVIFVDDFVGSGSQTRSTWHREYGSGPVKTFADLAAAGVGSFHYAPLVMTREGQRVVDLLCPGLQCRAVHILDDSYSALAVDSRIWPAGMRDDGVEFLKRVSVKHGMLDTGGSHVDDWTGFAGLGLCFAFQHSIPDATLPLFRWEEDGWTPLMRRS